MYDRYTIYSAAEGIKDAMEVDVSEDYQPSYNACATQRLPIITNQTKNELSFSHWGLMSKWSNNKSTISAKSINLSAETAFQRAAYKRQIQTHRCIVPINGFYAWKQVAKKRSVPYYFFSRQFPLMGMAGLWEEFEDIDGVFSHSFIILTVAASASLLEFENQMPTILSPMECKKWLDCDELLENQQLIFTIAIKHPTLDFHAVTPSISSISNNYPELILSVPASDQHGNYTLFS